jgi:phospholipid-binding lipoprotein MlaA
LNELLDRAVGEPLAQGYNAIMPAPVNRGVTNFFDNIRDVRSAINNLLQLKIGRAFSDVGRIGVNTTIGILGFMDVASNMDLPSYKEDFGQTLGVWGVESGPFLVLPIFGPSSVRDGVGLVADWFVNPIRYVDDDAVMYSLVGLALLDTRADLLTASRVVDQAALDPYAFIRDAYLQRRENLVHDGDPPDFEDSLDFD